MNPLLQLVEGHDCTWGDLVEAFATSCSPCTGRSYHTAILQFLGECHLTPDRITVIHVAAWRDALRTAKRSPATVRARVAAVSSFYAWLMQPLGQRGPVLTANPAAGLRLEKVPAFGRSRKVDKAMFQAILGAIPDSIQGLEDRAWLTGFVLTGRRRSELATLTWEQIERGPRWRYKYRGKGGKEGHRELPQPVVRALTTWLAARGETPPTSGPVWTVSSQTMARRLKGYARAAGLDPRLVRLHGLRHLAATARWEATGDVRQVKDFLDHSSIAITELYLAKLQDHGDDGADDVWRGLTGL